MIPDAVAQASLAKPITARDRRRASICYVLSDLVASAAAFLIPGPGRSTTQ